MNALILADPRESRKRCSLTPLRGRTDFEFVTYRPDRRVDASGFILLHHEGPALGPGDAGSPLMLIDCAWRRLPSLLATVDGAPRRRSLPPVITAYPRKSSIFDDPGCGLASIEALYAAAHFLGDPWPDLLEGYHWGAEFLRLNPELS